MIGWSGRRDDGDQRANHHRHLDRLHGPDRLDHLADAQPGPPDRADLHRPGVLRARLWRSSKKSASRSTRAIHLPDHDVKGEIAFEDVGFEYEAGSPVLQDINFHCQPGQVVALLGSTGSGKTTLVNLLPRFYEYTAGQHLAGWGRAEPLPAPLPAPPDRHRGAGALPLLALHPRKHHLRRGPRGAAGGDRSGGQGGRDPRCDPVLPARVRHPGGRERRHPLRRAEAARGHRAHPAEEPAHPDPGRFDLLGRHRDRSRDPRGAAKA